MRFAPPPPYGATPPSGGSKLVRLASPPPYGATPPLVGSIKSGRLCKCKSIPPPHGAIPPLSGPMTVNWKLVSQLPTNGAVVPQATKSLKGLQPPTLYQTGGLITGAETDKLRLQNRRRHHALQDQQMPTTLWSNHMGQASLQPRQECPLEYRNEMCPAGIATLHPAGELLSEWSQLGWDAHKKQADLGQKRRCGKQWLEGLTNRPDLLKHSRVSQRKALKK